MFATNKFDKGKKRVIFIGGARGIGKHALAKRIQSQIQNSIILSKRDCSTVIRNTLMEIYRKHPLDISSLEYIYKVEPIEYDHLVKNMKHLAEMNGCSIILIGQFFRQFSEDEWIKEMKSFCKNNGYLFDFIFLCKDSMDKRNNNQKRYLRENLRLREYINTKINIIENSTSIKNYITSDVYKVAL